MHGKPLLMFSTHGYTRDARRCADDAGIALFILEGEGHSINAGNAFGREHLPQTL